MKIITLLESINQYCLHLPYPVSNAQWESECQFRLSIYCCFKTYADRAPTNLGSAAPLSRILAVHSAPPYELSFYFACLGAAPPNHINSAPARASSVAGCLGFNPTNCCCRSAGEKSHHLCCFCDAGPPLCSN